MLTFNHGIMNTSKTALLLMTAHAAREKGLTVTLVKPAVDTRDGYLNITSRIGISEEANIVISETEEISKEDYQILTTSQLILVDEAQFLSEKNVEMLRYISNEMQISIVCYGLLTNYQTKLFTGSKRLIELADNITEISTLQSLCIGKGDCSCCYINKARINSKINIDDNIIKDGSVIVDVGAEEKYKPLCWKCWTDSV